MEWKAFYNDMEGTHVLDGGVIVCEHVMSDHAMNMIIAAPDLLVALKAACDVMQGLQKQVPTMWLAAIAKAEGTTT